MAYWIPAYLAGMKPYLDNPNVSGMYGRWNHPPPPGNPNAPGEGGVDLASSVGVPVYALQDGQIIAAGYWKDIGHGVVTVRCNIPGYGENDLYYQHIVLDPSIKQCTSGCTQQVKRGQKLGVVGEYGEVELGLNANWGGVWGTNHPAAWADDPRPQIKALMALGAPGSVSNSSTGQQLILRAFVDQTLADLRGGAFGSSQNIDNFFISWAHHEGGGVTNDAKFNPLNTMQTEPGSTQAAGLLPGIQAYPDGATGIKATVDALQNGNYPSLVHALATNDETNLGFTARGAPSFAHQMASNVAGDLSVWVSGRRSPLAEDYILAIMSGAGISNASVQGGTRNGPTGTPQATIDSWANVSLGEDTNGITVGGATSNVLSGLENINQFFGQLSGFFSDPTRLVKIIGGAALIIGGLALLIKSLAPGGK